MIKILKYYRYLNLIFNFEYYNYYIMLNDTFQYCGYDMIILYLF